MNQNETTTEIRSLELDVRAMTMLFYHLQQKVSEQATNIDNLTGQIIDLQLKAVQQEGPEMSDSMTDFIRWAGGKAPLERNGKVIYKQLGLEQLKK